jgi:UDP-N-acetylmuramyl pentapeptide phosphotransferase/UDP-N-acetylglucosamine-1-phosphate transferase
MPTWLTPLLKWGGILVAIVFAATLIWIWQTAPGPEAGAEAARDAPVTLYWVLLVVGVIAAIVGFALDRRKGQSTN